MANIVAVTALLVLSASTALAQQQMVAFDRDHPLRFDHLCAELGHGYGAYRQAYAVFEKRSPDGRYRALVLAKVHVGWIAGPPGPNGVSLLIEKKRLTLPPDWYDDTFGLAVQLVAAQTQQTITGPVFTRYVQVAAGYGAEQEYRLSAGGELDWERFAEPEERDPQSAREHRPPRAASVRQGHPGPGRDVCPQSGVGKRPHFRRFTLSVLAQFTRRRLS